MDKTRIFRLIKFLNLFSFPVALVILYFMAPHFSGLSERLKQALAIWFIVFGFCATYLNHQAISAAELIKEGADWKDAFSIIGYSKIRKNPEIYFSPEAYARYNNCFRFCIFLMIAAFTTLVVIINFASK